MLLKDMHQMLMVSPLRGFYPTITQGAVTLGNALETLLDRPVAKSCLQRGHTPITKTGC